MSLCLHLNLLSFLFKCFPSSFPSSFLSGGGRQSTDGKKRESKGRHRPPLPLPLPPLPPSPPCFHTMNTSIYKVRLRHSRSLLGPISPASLPPSLPPSLLPFHLHSKPEKSAMNISIQQALTSISLLPFLITLVHSLYSSGKPHPPSLPPSLPPFLPCFTYVNSSGCKFRPSRMAAITRMSEASQRAMRDWVGS